ncbi:MAG: chondroitin 4-O-sulfotransferase [Acidobacteria bacterium]|nr:MAG: chondroitin 4-O-sulfotransferase [Acidobacteriota bacterium]
MSAGRLRHALACEWRHWRHARRWRRERRARWGEYTLADFERLGCLFVHVPKTGGVSVARALFGHLAGGHRTVDEYLVLYGHLRFARLFRFAFVRDPFTRLESAFRFLKAGGMNDDDRRWAEEHLAGIDDLEQFCVSWLTPENARSWVHFRPQADFVCDATGRLRVDFVGKFERLAEDFDAVCRRLGRRAELPHLNRSAPRRRDPRETLPDAARRRVAEVYRRDFELFGYSVERAQGPA